MSIWTCSDFNITISCVFALKGLKWVEILNGGVREEFPLKSFALEEKNAFTFITIFINAQQENCKS